MPELNWSVPDVLSNVIPTKLLGSKDTKYHFAVFADGSGNVYVQNKPFSEEWENAEFRKAQTSKIACFLKAVKSENGAVLLRVIDNAKFGTRLGDYISQQLNSKYKNPSLLLTSGHLSPDMLEAVASTLMADIAAKVKMVEICHSQNMPLPIILSTLDIAPTSKVGEYILNQMGFDTEFKPLPQRAVAKAEIVEDTSHSLKGVETDHQARLSAAALTLNQLKTKYGTLEIAKLALDYPNAKTWKHLLDASKVYAKDCPVNLM